MPVYFFRYEDLVTDPASVLSKMFAFVLGVPDIEGTFIEKRMMEVISTGSKGNTLYKPRSGGAGFNKNKDKYNEQQMQYIMENLEDLLNFFGYTD